jgi:hypothetical protein
VFLGVLGEVAELGEEPWQCIYYPCRPAALLVFLSIFGLFVRLAESNPFLRAAVTD